MREIWKDIQGYEMLYQVSNQGRVRSLDRVVSCKNGKRKNLHGNIIRPQRCSNGYLFVCLSKQGTVRQHRVHRLVAIAFLQRQDDKCEVNHINECKTDNNVSNLEWLSHRDNIVHGTQQQRGVAHRNQRGERNGMFGRKGKLNPHSKRVLQLDLNGNRITSYDSIREAAVATNSNASSITSVCRGRLIQTNGYKWQYQ